MKTLVLGLGNGILSDDSVGLRVVEELRAARGDDPAIDIDEDHWGGLRLMERMIGYDRAIVVDAICTGAAPGTLHRLRVDGLPTQRSASAHDANLATALTFGRQAGAHLPADDNILLIGIEAADVTSFSENCTPPVAAAIPRAVQAIEAALVAERFFDAGDSARATHHPAADGASTATHETSRSAASGPSAMRDG